MRKLLTTAAFVLALGGAAQAGDLSINCNSQFYGSSYSGGCKLSEDQGPRALTQEELAENARLDAKWLEFCKPVRHTDDEGVTRLSYAHKGCEFGRVE